MARGGFPDVVTLTGAASRRRYFRAYLDDLIEREITGMGEIDRLRELNLVLRLLAARTGSLLVINPIASDARLAAARVRRYLALLEQRRWCSPSARRRLVWRGHATARALMDQ